MPLVNGEIAQGEGHISGMDVAESLLALWVAILITGSSSQRLHFLASLAAR